MTKSSREPMLSGSRMGFSAKILALALTLLFFTTVLSADAIGPGPADPVPMANDQNYDFIIYKEEGDVLAAYAPTGVVVYKSPNATTVFNSCLSELGPYGGSVYVRSGNYPISSPIEPPRTRGGEIIIRGESREDTVLTSTEANYLVVPWGNLTLSDLTLDGDGVGKMLFVSGEPYYYFLNNLKVTRHTGIGVWFGPVKGFSVIDCQFFDAMGEGDQLAFDCQEYGYVINNRFDRTTGDVSGSCLTSGGGNNVLISGNVIIRSERDYCHGISLEPMTELNNMRNFTISDNTIENGALRIGAFHQLGTVSEIKITNNHVRGDIFVFSSSPALTASIQISDNTIEAASEGAGIIVSDVSELTVQRNTVVEDPDANIPHHIGLITIVRSHSVQVLGNDILMAPGSNQTLLSCIFLREDADVTITGNRLSPTSGRLALDIDFLGEINLTISGNPGTTTANYGHVSVEGNATSMVVEHGLVLPPLSISVRVEEGEVGETWITNVTSSSFVINFVPTPSVDCLTLEWHAYVYANVQEDT